MKKADSDPAGTHVPKRGEPVAPENRLLHRGGPEHEKRAVDGTAPDSSRQEGPGTGTTRSQGIPGRDGRKEKRQRVSWDWLKQNACYVEYKGENIMKDCESYPAPEGGFEVGLSEAMIWMAENNQDVFNSWILIEPDKNGVGCFFTRSRNDLGRNAR